MDPVYSTSNHGSLPSCHHNHSSEIFLLSKLCVNGSNINGEYDCFDKSFEHCPYRKSLGVWAIIIMFIGVFGNLLTLLAIPYAARKQRYTYIYQIQLFPGLS
jgi:hypothetical protein